MVGIAVDCVSIKYMLLLQLYAAIIAIPFKYKIHNFSRKSYFHLFVSTDYNLLYKDIFVYVICQKFSYEHPRSQT